MHENIEYLIEKIDEPKPQLRVFRVADKTSQLIIPKCVASLRLMEPNTSTTALLDGLIGAMNLEMKTQDTNIEPVDLDSAISTVIDFMDKNVVNFEKVLTRDEDFQNALIESVRANSPRDAALLTQHLNMSTESADQKIYTGFYL